MLKMGQLTNKLRQLKERMQYRNGTDTMSLRKARTLTLIQLGGLIAKANLLEPLDINLGDNLQKDEAHFDSVATLMGALAEIYPTMQNDVSQKILWQEKGKKLLAV